MQTFYSGVGVGVYQGEMVTIQKWVFSEPHQWVIGRFQAPDSHLYQRDIVCKLLQAALILAHYLQSDAGKNYSQSPNGIRLSRNCPHAKPQKNAEDTLSKECENVECPLPDLLAKESVPPLYQHSPECPQCPFEGSVPLWFRHSLCYPLLLRGLARWLKQNTNIGEAARPRYGSHLISAAGQVNYYRGCGQTSRWFQCLCLYLAQYLISWFYSVPSVSSCPLKFQERWQH